MNKNLLLVAISIFTWGLGEGFFIYFQPLYLQQWGANSIEIGGILGAVGIVLALSQIPTGILVDKFGPYKIMWLSWVLGVIATAGMVLASSLTVFVISYLLYGLTGFGAIAMNAYVINNRGKLSVGRALSLISGMYNLGAVMGPIAGGQIADRLGLRSIYIVAGVIFVISTIIVMFASPEHHLHPEDVVLKNQPSGGIMQNPRLLIFLGLSFITMLALYMPQPLTSNFLQNQQGLSNSTIGLLGAAGSLGNAFATLVLGNISPFLGLMIGQVWVLIFAAAFLWGNSPMWFGIGYFFFGGYRLSRSMSLAYARPMARIEQTGLLFGAMETTNSVAVILAPIFAGLLYDQNPYLVYRVALISIAGVICLNLFVLKLLIPHLKEEKQ